MLPKGFKLIILTGFVNQRPLFIVKIWFKKAINLQIGTFLLL